MNRGEKRRDLESDDIAWEIDTRSRPIFVVGDVHGDLDALLTILAGLNLIDLRTGTWVAQDTILITMGDHVDRRGDSRGVLDLLLLTEFTAPGFNSESHHLLGNHELERVQQRVPFLSASDRAALRDRQPNGSLETDYPGDDLYIDWFLRRNTIMKAGDCLFAHAGLGDWATTVCPGQVNAAIRRWIEFFAGIVSTPPDKCTQ